MHVMFRLVGRMHSPIPPPKSATGYHSQTVYNTAKSISPGNTYTEKLSQKSFHLHQPHFGFGRDEVFFFLNIVRSSNKFYRAKQRNLIFVQNCRVKNTVLSLEIFGCHLPWNRTN